MPANQSHIKSNMSILIYCKPCLVKPPLKGLPADGQAPSMSRQLHVAIVLFKDTASKTSRDTRLC